MPRMVEDRLELTESELFDLESELHRLKQIEGFNRASHTTIDKCILLVQMYSALRARHELCQDESDSSDVGVLTFASDMTRIHELSCQARDNDYFKDDLLRRIIDITLKYKA